MSDKRREDNDPHLRNPKAQLSLRQRESCVPAADVLSTCTNSHTARAIDLQAIHVNFTLEGLFRKRGADFRRIQRPNCKPNPGPALQRSEAGHYKDRFG